MSADRMIDQRAAAALLGLRPRTLEAWRLRGTGPTYRRIGRRVRYLETDVLTWRDREVVHPASPVVITGQSEAIDPPTRTSAVEAYLQRKRGQAAAANDPGEVQGLGDAS